MRNLVGRRIGLLAASFFLVSLFIPMVAAAQEPAPDAGSANPTPGNATTPSETTTPSGTTTPGGTTPGGSGGRHRGQGQDDTAPRPIIGRIAAIQNGSLKITRPDESEMTVKITDKTEFRRDREAAKLKDFKVGDFILVRGEENADFSITAQLISGRTGNGPNGPNRQNPAGTLGKDYVVGEVKALDPPSITVIRTDNVKQTFELNEDTSLRKGRDSVTMADMQVGDHIFARGALQDNQFVPKTVVVIGPEQWKRMQEMGVTSPGAGKPAQQGSAPSKPTEPPN